MLKIIGTLLFAFIFSFQTGMCFAAMRGSVQAQIQNNRETMEQNKQQMQKHQQMMHQKKIQQQKTPRQTQQ